MEEEEERVTADEMLDGITDSMNLGKLWEMVRNREAWHAAIHGVTKSGTQITDCRTKISQFIWNTKEPE